MYLQKKKKLSENIEGNMKKARQFQLFQQLAEEKRVEVEYKKAKRLSNEPNNYRENRWKNTTNHMNEKK